MKYYSIESHYEKEAPFGIAWQVKLFDEHTLLEEYDHIFYNEITGYCKCCLLYTSPSPRDGLLSRMPSSA